MEMSAFNITIPWKISGCEHSDRFGVKVGRFQLINPDPLTQSEHREKRQATGSSPLSATAQNGHAIDDKGTMQENPSPAGWDQGR